MFFGLSVDEETQAWVLDSFDWAIDNGILTRDTRLIRPDGKTFPVSKGSPTDVAKGLVQCIQTLLDIPDAPIDVRPLDVLPAEYRYDPNATSQVGGTWQSDGNTAVITFDPEMVARPVAFISLLAHEVMHHRLHLTAMDMPGGFEAEELSTDLHCITAGFGLFQLAGAEEAGWQGYLRQETRAFALAVFLAVTEEPVETVAQVLSRRSQKLLQKAQKLLQGWDEDLMELQHKRQRAT